MAPDLNPGDENVILLSETSEGRDESTDLSRKSLPGGISPSGFSHWDKDVFRYLSLLTSIESLFPL
ncbi:cupin [Sesbania bispinosa]|nr:cupin [Sesbania bispinosa]